MLTDTMRKELDTIGKMVRALMTKFLGKSDEFNATSFQMDIQANNNLNQLYHTTDLDGFRRIILALNVDEHLRLSLIHFFYRLHLTEIEADKKQLAKEKCLALIQDATTVNMGIFEISQKLNEYEN